LIGGEKVLSESSMSVRSMDDIDLSRCPRKVDDTSVSITNTNIYEETARERRLPVKNNGFRFPVDRNVSIMIPARTALESIPQIRVEDHHYADDEHAVTLGLRSFVSHKISRDKLLIVLNNTGTILTFTYNTPEHSLYGLTEENFSNQMNTHGFIKYPVVTFDDDRNTFHMNLADRTFLSCLPSGAKNIRRLINKYHPRDNPTAINTMCDLGVCLEDDNESDFGQAFDKYIFTLRGHEKHVDMFIPNIVIHVGLLSCAGVLHDVEDLRVELRRVARERVHNDIRMDKYSLLFSGYVVKTNGEIQTLNQKLLPEGRNASLIGGYFRYYLVAKLFSNIPSEKLVVTFTYELFSQNLGVYLHERRVKIHVRSNHERRMLDPDAFGSDFRFPIIGTLYISLFKESLMLDCSVIHCDGEAPYIGGNRNHTIMNHIPLIDVEQE